MDITHSLLDNAPGEPPTITTSVRVGELSRDTIEKCARYLIDYVDQWVALAECQPNRLFPIEIIAGGSTRIPESLFWRLVIENSGDPGSLNVAFVNALCARIEKAVNLGGRVFYSSEEYGAGAFAMFAWLDCLSGESIYKLDRSKLAATYDCFLRYLRCCDLDHEVHEDRYISEVLKQLRYLSPQRYLKLLHLRLFDGQFSVWARDYNFFRDYIGVEQLKTVLDYVVAKNDAVFVENGGSHDLGEYLRIVASVYGSNREKTQEIANYICSSVTASIANPDDMMARSRDVQLVCDAYRAAARSRKGFLDSGFHKYDQAAKVWLDTAADPGDSGLSE